MSRIFYLFFSCFFLISTLVSAQDTLYNQLNEVVVTANKFEQKQNTTGKVITVINKEQIEKSAGKTLPQLLNEQAGITVNGALNNLGSVQTVYTRGAASGRTLILLDGIPVNDPSMINNEFDLNLISLSGIEKIEICKGAQSTLYGSDAVAGVINIITVKKNITQPIAGAASAVFGNRRTTKANAELYGKTGKLSYTARYANLHSNGFSSAADTMHNNTHNFDNDGYDGNVANAQLNYQASKALSFKTYALYSNYKADIDAGVFTDDKDYTIHNKSFLGGAGFTYKKSIFSITGNYQYSETKRRFLNDSLDKASTVFEDNRYGSKTQLAELYGNVVLGKYFTVLAGADYRFSSYNQLYNSVSAFVPFSDTAPARSINQKSAYLSFILSDAKKKLTVELGGRINDQSIYGGNSTFTFNPSYNLSNQVHVFGSVSTGYKAPGIFQLFDVYSGNKELQPEESKNYEAGLSFQDKIFGMRGVFFNRNISNAIDYNYITYRYFNYVKQKVNGIELEVNLKPVRFLTFNANYTFLSPRETAQNRTTNQDTVTYLYLLRRPNNSVNATIGVQPAKAFYFSVSGKYVSRRYDVGGYLQPDHLLNSYFLLGAYAEYNMSNKARLFADAQNLFNKTFYDVNGYNSLPFTLNAGVKVSF